MMLNLSLQRQKGATLVVALIVLLLFTLLVTSGFNLSITNMQAVGNMQVKHEAVAVASTAIEQIISSDFTSAPTSQDLHIDIDNDDTADYQVSISTPTCIRASQASSAALSSSSLSAMSSYGTWNTVWSLTATVNDQASGASARIRSGVRVLLSQAEKDAVCN